MMAGKRKTDFALSLDRQMIEVAIVEAVEKGATLIPYEDLSALIGREVREVMDLLRRARKGVQRDHQVVTFCVPRVGVQILSNGEKARSGRSSVVKIRREVRRGIERSGCADFRILNNEELTAVLTDQSILGAIGAAASTKAIRRIEARVTEDQEKKVLPLEETLKHFSVPARRRKR